MAPKFIWVSGFITAFTWSLLNFFITLKILRMAVLKENKSGLPTLLLIKFPLLYLAGFLILISGLFPAKSLLAGMTPIFLIAGYKLWQKQG